MKSVLLIGLGNFGMMIAKQIHELGHQVMAVDIDEERVNEALPYATNALIGDSTNANFLASLGVNNFDVCIETIGNNFQSSLETTSLLKELGGKKVVSRANREVQAKFLLRNGADEVVNPEKQIAKWTAIRYTSDHILDYIKLDDNHATKPFSVEELLARLCVMQRRIALLQSDDGAGETCVYTNGKLRIDYAAGCAYKGEEELKLTPIEYKLLCLLAQNTGKVLTHKYITQKIWGSAWDSNVASLRVFMATLRKKLEDEEKSVSYIQTHIGIGYRMLKV